MDRCPFCLSLSLEESPQGVKGCQCELQSSEQELFSTLEICSVCGKKVNLSSHGRLSQWIFRADLCSCARPCVKLRDRTGRRGTKPTTIDYPELKDLDSDFPLERYKPVELLGSGTSGLVYRSQDRKLNKSVAVKVMRNYDPLEVVSFQEEAKITAQLEHNNIIGIVDINVTRKGTPYMVLEYVPGVTLNEHLKSRGKLDGAETIEIALQICAALQYAHGKTIFHRDLKPANILLGKDPEGAFLVKIIDFGLAKLLTREDASYEYQGRTIAGTPRYMSPDQLQGKQFDARAEIYSLGCILYEMLSGCPPFDSDNALEVFAMHAMDKATPLSPWEDSAVDVKALSQVVSKCLEKDPEKRYEDVNHLSVELKKCLRAEPILEPTVPQEVRVLKKKNVALFYGILFLILSGSVFYFVFELEKKEADSEFDLGQPIRFTQTVHKKDELGHFVKEGENGFVKATKLVDDDSLKMLANRTDIDKLNLARTMVDGPGLRYLEKLPLKALVLDKTGITDSDVKVLAKFPELQYLSINKTEVTGKYLDKLENLIELDLTFTRLNDQGFENISKLKKLQILRFSSNHCTARGVADLERLPILKVLGVVGNHGFSEYFSQSPKLKALNVITIENRILLPEDIELIDKYSVEKLYLTYCLFYEGIAEKLSNCSGLRHLRIWNCKISEEEVHQIRSALKNCQLEYGKDDSRLEPFDKS